DASVPGRFLPDPRRRPARGRLAQPVARLAAVRTERVQGPAGVPPRRTAAALLDHVRRVRSGRHLAGRVCDADAAGPGRAAAVELIGAFDRGTARGGLPIVPSGDRMPARPPSVAWLGRGRGTFA